MNTDTTDVYVLMAHETLRNGGGTYARDAFRTKTMPNRYVVALGKPLSYAIPASLGNEAFPAIVHALRTLADAQDVWTPERGLGTWLDVDSNTVYVDIVESLPNRYQAKSAARERGELAIWDKVDNVSIYV